MKKKLILAAALVAVTLSASATDIFVSWCGKQAYTIDAGLLPEYFTPEDIEGYYQDLNFELCGAESPYLIIPG